MWSQQFQGSRSDMAATVKWTNQMLSMGGYSDHLVTDLASDMADGTTLLKLVQTVANEILPSHSSTPIFHADKLKNLQICLDFLHQRSIHFEGVQAEDLAAGDIESILTVCNALRKHYAGESVSQTSTKVQRSLVYAAIEKEDVALFTWVGNLLLRKDIKSYSIFYDGTILAKLVNMLHQDAIKDAELERAMSGVERLKLVESAAQKHLFISPSFDPLLVESGGQDGRLQSFLSHCKSIYQQQTHRRGILAHTSSKTRPPSSEKTMGGGGGGREAREAARISARSYDAIHKRKTEGDNLSQPSRKKHSELYVQGASSVTDLTTRRAEHKTMVHGTGRMGGLSKHSSTEHLEHKNRGLEFGGGLDRVQSMESGIAQQESKPWRIHQDPQQNATLPRSASQGTLPVNPHIASPSRPAPSFSKSLTRSTENFHTHTFGSFPTHRTPSYMRLDSSTTSDDLTNQLSALEERVKVLATQFLYERQDMFKQILRKLGKERKKRQLAEERIEALERASRQLVQHYDSRFICLAKEVSSLKTDRTLQKGGALSNTITMEIEQLKEQLANLNKIQTSPTQVRLTSLPAPASLDHTVFLRKRTGSELKPAGSTEVGLLGPHSKGSAASFKKLSRFFGEDPPRVETLESFLEDLGYMHLLPKLREHNISLAELTSLSEAHLEAIGVPLGARVRLMEGVKKLEPVENTRLRRV